ncbi:bifunctional oligoribonuclease/PAP phosphatase NrnA [Paenibacillus melissococcoides]|uniref:Bifunctional oligoribonuclease/PAP phosphatase NrnA n=1 Tax=Paenibacillus melissococcoides TaxID=2912268 RepID=A0ABN8TZT4_9BACL|nr:MULTISPECIES: bifunctional oligoribonuclease/PAP phosphatase NrnA [Paenibacillus]MEB9892533.1 bifunctional oligoribonuclease/PAP phosphatase NrnA [Bacillus cereus]CAH8243822.1 bifunctional oligoribonuclease/PAP phosphatase NrnA [Paenibacillus melissococcoides]CAH8704492.1 bifunctional oligoribonuclease/PAP phosphatase NrnA [Paenibacillus melissococcoides]CAH8707266.1 bifunctional oligoribonuclease/PAP phosphatase NrnA [Paenibacillus melissococcoides]GIO77316.1 DHH family phosphoesterase [Pa
MAEMLSDRYAEDIERACEFLRSCDDALVVSHVQPDGDAISSTLVIGWLLDKWNKTYRLVNENGVPGRLRDLPMADQIGSYADEDAPEKKYETVICVDCADYARIGKIANWIAPDARILNIDHHPTNDRYGEAALIRHNAAATAEILYDLLLAAGVELDEQVGTMLYTGLLTDTGGFRYSNTTPHVMSVASELLKLGVEGNTIAERLLETMSMAQLKLIQRGLSRLTFTPDQRIGWLFITPEDMRETGAVNEDLEGLVNYARNVEGVDVGLLFKQIDEQSVKVSMRSSERVDVSAIAQSFGGGGHVRAAGCKVSGALDDIIRQVVERVKQEL